MKLLKPLLLPLAFFALGKATQAKTTTDSIPNPDLARAFSIIKAETKKEPTRWEFHRGQANAGDTLKLTYGFAPTHRDVIVIDNPNKNDGNVGSGAVNYYRQTPAKIRTGQTFNQNPFRKNSPPSQTLGAFKDFIQSTNDWILGINQALQPIGENTLKDAATEN